MLALYSEFSLKRTNFIFPIFITRLAVPSFISSANISRMVRWFALRYFGMATLNSTRRSPDPPLLPPSFFIPIPDRVILSPVPVPVATLTLTSPSSVGILTSPPRTAVVSGILAVYKISDPARPNFESGATLMKTKRSPFVERTLELAAAPVGGGDDLRC